MANFETTGLFTNSVLPWAARLQKLAKPPRQAGAAGPRAMSGPEDILKGDLNLPSEAGQPYLAWPGAPVRRGP